MTLDRLLIFAVAMAAMWFLLIRPQQQRQKQHKQTVAALAAGQRIVTIGGLVAEIVEVRGDRLLLRVADGSEMEYVREAVGRVLRDDELVAEDAPVAEDAENDLLDEPDGSEDTVNEGEDAE
jgi:preprotein translocase subunit YajC